MNHTRTTLDLNHFCLRCGRRGTAPNGLCLPCNGIAIDGGNQNQAGVAEQKSTRPQPNPASRGLAGTLLSLILKAERENDHRFYGKPLTGGLFVEVGLGTQFNLRISRESPSAPSAREWTTVVSYLPDAYKPTEQIMPKDDEHGGRKYLGATWPFRQRMI